MTRNCKIKGGGNNVGGNNLLRAIQMYDFYLIDLNLFLDTHPNDRKALAKFNEMREKRQQAYDAYIAKYGPITAVQSDSEDYFDWIDGPWPWERSAN